MVKPANKLYLKKMFKKGLQLLSIFIVLNSATTFAQETKLENGKEYILADIAVTGKISYNAQTVTTFTGLEKGQSIMVPGEDISIAIKKLWKLGLFSDVNFYVNKSAMFNIHENRIIHNSNNLWISVVKRLQITLSTGCGKLWVNRIKGKIVYKHFNKMEVL